MIDEVKAGRLVFKIRKEPDKVKAFFWFVQTLALVSADIDEIHGRQRVESVCDGETFGPLTEDSQRYFFCAVKQYTQLEG